MNTNDYVELINSMPGNVVTGFHKNPGQAGKTLSVEVTAVAAIPTRWGTGTYLFGTIVDDPKNAGRVVAVKAGGYDLRTVDIRPAQDFEAVKVDGYWVRGKDADQAADHFSWLEKLEADEDIALAREVGMKPLAAFIVGKPAKKASRKSRKAVETPAEPAE